MLFAQLVIFCNLILAASYRIKLCSEILIGVTRTGALYRWAIEIGRTAMIN